MRTFLATTLCLLAVRALAATPTEAEFDQQLVAELAAKSPEAARLFSEANTARDRRDDAGAIALYQKVETMLPASSHAFRRHAGVLMTMDRAKEALPLARKALQLETRAENEAVLAEVLLATRAPGAATEALALASQAVARAPEDEFVRIVECQAALTAGDWAHLRSAVDGLERRAPQQPGTHYFKALSLAVEGDFEAALASLDRARTLGLPEENYLRIRDNLLQARPWHVRAWPIAWRAIALWLGGLAILLVAGMLLSALTLRALRGPQGGAGGQASGAEAVLRRIYGGVLWLCCVYYYLSIPISALLVIGLGGGILYALLAIGQIPIKLVAIVVILMVTTLGAILKSLFARARDIDPGPRLDLAANPRLRALLDEVAAKVGTAPVDVVYLTPDTEVAVTERGGFLGPLRGRTQRSLILGVAVLDGFTLGPLRAVLAHEYGHFSNQDTAGGGFALTVRRSLLTLAQSLARGGAAAWYNPVWIFINGFYRVFIRISHGASRLQETLADRWAALSYGAAAFEHGLQHVIGASIRFDEHVASTLREVIDHKRPLPNLYRYRPSNLQDAGTFDERFGAALTRKPSPYDSHPSPADRIAAVHALGFAPERTQDDDEPAWSLFADRESLEGRMTEQVRGQVAARFGVAIPVA
jgi:Zn-dependent protease with chaperone function